MWNFLKIMIDEYGFRRVEKGMTEEEYYIFMFDGLHKCKHCKRMTGYKINKEGVKLFEKIRIEVRKKELRNYLKKLGIAERLLSKDGVKAFNINVLFNLPNYKGEPVIE